MTARLDRSRAHCVEWHQNATTLDDCCPHPTQTACKHGRDDCDRCGTLWLSDALHSTRRGRGAVARLKGSRNAKGAAQ